jgi:hypothetical protein
MHILDRIDPEPNGSSQPDLPMVPELTETEAISESAMYMDLFRGGLQVLLDLGVPVAAILGESRAIETTSTKVPEPEPAVRSADATPLETQPAAAPAEPPDVPKIYDAF